MTDLPSRKSTQGVKLVGADSNFKETNPVRATVAGDAGVVDFLSGSAVEGNVAVGPTPVPLRIGASNHTDRKFVMFEAPENMRWGFTNGITSSLGYNARKGALVRIKASDARDVYLVCANSISVFCSEVI